MFLTPPEPSSPVIVCLHTRPKSWFIPSQREYSSSILYMTVACWNIDASSELHHFMLPLGTLFPLGFHHFHSGLPKPYGQ